MCVILSPDNLNHSPYFPHPISTYTFFYKIQELIFVLFKKKNIYIYIVTITLKAAVVKLDCNCININTFKNKQLYTILNICT